MNAVVLIVYARARPAIINDRFSFTLFVFPLCTPLIKRKSFGGSRVAPPLHRWPSRNRILCQFLQSALLCFFFLFSSSTANGSARFAVAFGAAAAYTDWGASEYERDQPVIRHAHSYFIARFPLTIGAFRTSLHVYMVICKLCEWSDGEGKANRSYIIYIRVYCIRW